jgi:hypothetical protein
VCTANPTRGCREKARELLSQVGRHWNPNRETSQRHTLWHTPQRPIRYKGLDPVAATVLYNPDPRSMYSILGGIRVSGINPGHKSKRRDPFQREKDPARIDSGIVPSGGQMTMSTEGSAVNNGWENVSAGVGVWYANSSERNIALKLESHVLKMATNSRAELGEILEALRQNEGDDLMIESDSLSSLRAICCLSNKHEDLNWSGIQMQTSSRAS